VLSIFVLLIAEYGYCRKKRKAEAGDQENGP
jgi:hypothetical protein